MNPKLSILYFLVLLTPILGALQNLFLYVKSNNHSINNWYLYTNKEGNGINYFYLAEHKASKLTYDNKKDYIYQQVNPHTKYDFLIRNNILQLSIFNPYKVTIKSNGELQFNGANDLYAVKNINDPTKFSNNNYAIVYYKNKKNVPKGAIPVDIYAKYVQ
ncbi:PGA30 Cell wall protein PGA30 [Candida maltosa Xu316]|uniref:Cell wall protein n=1 Tax=Candida maltosa (strain Xu316) TaxID=1245528 RepID=M3JX56_CANMX|nr:hypothetical protein G210_2731 [Candida maltosa Xu316]